MNVGKDIYRRSDATRVTPHQAVWQVGLGKGRTIKNINVYHISSANSGDGRCCLYRHTFTILEQAAKGNKTSVPSSTPQEQWNNREWCQESILHIFVSGHYCLFDLELTSYPALAGGTGLCNPQQAPHRPCLRNGWMGHPGTEYPDCSSTSQPSTLLQYPVWSQTEVDLTPSGLWPVLV